MNKMSMPTPIWYQYYNILQEDFPELVDDFIESTAATMELTVDYFKCEFL